MCGKEILGGPGSQARNTWGEGEDQVLMGWGWNGVKSMGDRQEKKSLLKRIEIDRSAPAYKIRIDR
jgi:hypothetical protein